MDKLKLKNMEMNYEQFDNLNNGSIRNTIILSLTKKPLNYEMLSEITGLDRTSVHYHVAILKKEKKIAQICLRRFTYLGLPKNMRNVSDEK